MTKISKLFPCRLTAAYLAVCCLFMSPIFSQNDFGGLSEDEIMIVIEYRKSQNVSLSQMNLSKLEIAFYQDHPELMVTASSFRQSNVVGTVIGWLQKRVADGFIADAINLMMGKKRIDICDIAVPSFIQGLKNIDLLPQEFEIKP